MALPNFLPAFMAAVALRDVPAPLDAGRMLRERPKPGSEERRTWTHLLRRIRECSRDESFVLFLARHLKVVSLLSRAPYAAFASDIPRLASRYSRDYLALSLGVARRRAIFLFHHKAIAEALNDETLQTLARSKLTVWRRVVDAESYAISLRMDRSLHGEGDLVLEFWRDETCLFDLSFSIAPPDGDGASPTMLVTRLQGRPNCFESIRRATKDNGDIFPGHLLLCAAEGVARTLGVTRLCGVSSEDQLSSQWGLSCFDYNRFWSELVEDRRDGWFTGTLPLSRKPLEAIPVSHRRRTRRKRAFKDGVIDQAGEALAQGLRRA